MQIFPTTALFVTAVDIDYEGMKNDEDSESRGLVDLFGGNLLGNSTVSSAMMMFDNYQSTNQLGGSFI